jgi:plasmid stabilization system protein ParE
MPHVKVSKRAQVDLSRLHDFLAQHDQEKAKEAIDVILTSFDDLHMPMIGAPVMDSPGLRKLVIRFGAR